MRVGVKTKMTRVRMEISHVEYSHDRGARLGSGNGIGDGAPVKAAPSERGNKKRAMPLN